MASAAQNGAQTGLSASLSRFRLARFQGQQGGWTRFLPQGLYGWLRALLVLAAFCMRGMVALRLMAIASNLAFIGYAAMADIHPVLLLHADASSIWLLGSVSVVLHV